MNRFNYLTPSRRPLATGRLPTIAIDNRIRGPLAALVATMVLTGLLSIVQIARLHAAQSAYAAAWTRLNVDHSRLDDVETLRHRARYWAHVAADVDAIRNASLAHANELASIGNRLPAQTWLVTLRYEAGTYSLEGTSERASAVGTALLALHDDAGSATPQLVSLHDDGNAGRARFHYSLKLQTRP